MRFTTTGWELLSQTQKLLYAKWAHETMMMRQDRLERHFCEWTLIERGDRRMRMLRLFL